MVPLIRFESSFMYSIDDSFLRITQDDQKFTLSLPSREQRHFNAKVAEPDFTEITLKNVSLQAKGQIESFLGFSVPQYSDGYILNVQLKFDSTTATTNFVSKLLTLKYKQL